MSPRLTRRQLLKGAAAAAGGAALGVGTFGVPSVLADRSPNAKLGTVVIGAVNQGKPAVHAAADERLVALVDVDEGHLRKAKQFLAESTGCQPGPGPGVLRLPEDVRQDPQADRRRVHCRAGPPSRRRLADRHEAGQARLLREAAGHSIGEIRMMMAAARKYKVMTS